MTSILPFFRIVPLILLSTGLHAAQPAAKAPATDPDLPAPYDPNQGNSLLENSPFTRSLNLSDALILTGIAYIDGKPVATVLNKTTKENYVVSEEPNAQGWKLAETSAATKLNHTQAKIMIGTEVVTVRYSEEAMSPETNKKGGFKPGAGGPGGPQDNAPRREYPRPSQEDRDRYMSLPDEAKEKFRQIMTESREKMMNASPEERMAFAKKMFEQVESDAKAGSKSESKKSESKKTRKK